MNASLKRNFSIGSHIAFWAAALGVFSFRISYVLGFPEILFQPDSADYFSTTLNYGLHGFIGFPFLRAPVYPLFLLVITRLMGLGHLGLVQHMSLVLGLIFLAWALVRMHPTPGGRFISAAFLLVTGLSPSLFAYGSQIMSEGLAPQALILVILSICLWDGKHSAPWAIPPAFAVAFAVLLKPAYGVIVPVVLIVMGVAARRNAVKPILMFSGVFLLLISPWLLYNWKIHDRIALSNMGPTVLCHSYAHLLDMDSKKHASHKNAIQQSHAVYMKTRATMSKDQVRTAGIETVAGKSGFANILMSQSGMKEAQAHEAVLAMTLEGIAKNPEKAWQMVWERLAVFFTQTPGQAETAHSFYLERWASENGPDWVNRLSRETFQAYLPWETGMAFRRYRFQNAPWPVPIQNRLTAPFSRCAHWFFWGAILLFPAVFFGRARHIGLFLFLFIFSYSFLVCVTVPPLPRFFQPLVVPVLFLLSLEILGCFTAVVRLRAQPDKHTKDNEEA